ncbi:hypothetical protein A5722_14855 [Mycobacterium vulneris]|nr:hypothetical protein A5722_14855 [Mycolicibacterium vulneris]OCB66208.1 hypothetical protein A5729_12360 [Mycolicibacterium vulneris]
MEVWRSVPGYVGLYEVSDRGRVRSLGRVRTDRRGRTYRRNPKLLTLCPLKSGHPVVRLYGRGTGPRTLRVHALVLAAFVGPRPDGLEACHGDGDPSNNHVDNLRWDTRSANVLDSVKHGTHVSNQQRKAAA